MGLDFLFFLLLVCFLNKVRIYYCIISNRVNREDLWQMLRMYNVGIKLLSGIKSMYVDSSACVRVKRL